MEVGKFISVEVACALQSVHDYGVVYRGIKPENIMLDSYGHVKLIDFGFAKDIGESKKTFTLCGTPEYLAPEALEGNGFGHAADW
jgi:protein kinase A